MTVELCHCLTAGFAVCTYIPHATWHDTPTFIHVRVPKDPSAFLQDQISLTYMSPLSV